MNNLAIQIKQVITTYLHQVDECSEYGTSKHVVFFGLFPQQGQVLYQTACIRSDLNWRNDKITKENENTKGFEVHLCSKFLC